MLQALANAKNHDREHRELFLFDKTDQKAEDRLNCDHCQVFPKSPPAFRLFEEEVQQELDTPQKSGGLQCMIALAFTSSYDRY